MEEEERKKEVIELILDLGKYDTDHIILEAHELALARLVTGIGNFSSSMFDPSNITKENDTVIMAFSTIKPHLIDIYVNLVLITSHKSRFYNI
jgi:hypothetical protein